LAAEPVWTFLGKGKFLALARIRNPEGPAAITAYKEIDIINVNSI
jgi:hypothetical protein